ncbi:MAG: TolC family protein [Gemmatimonadota bacterium]|nr:MAG: TolC family protein [Gemmatimonadota bacterium]
MGGKMISLVVLALVSVSAATAVRTEGQTKVFTLEEAVRQALDESAELQDARFDLEVANEQVSEAWGSLYPQVDFSASYTRNLTVAQSFLPAVIFDPNADPDDLVPVRFGADNIWRTSVTVEQALFKPEVFVGLGAAGRFKNLQVEALRGRTQTVVTRVRIGYYNLLLAREQVRLTDNSVRRVRESLRETRALNAAGLAADYDVLRLEVELANLEPNLRRAVNGEAGFTRQLGIDLGLDRYDEIEVAGSLADMQLDDFDANSPENREILAFSGTGADGRSTRPVLRMASDDRSDLRQLALTEDLKRAELKLQRVDYLPEIALFGAYTVVAQENGSPDFFGENDFQRTTSQLAGIRISLPLFQGFSRDARVDGKRAELRQAEARSRLARNQAEHQVTTLLDQLDEALERARAQRSAVGQARRGFEIASAQYREGLGSQLELTDAEVALRESEFNYAQAVYDYLVAEAQLDQAVGKVPMVDSRDGSTP